MKQYLLLVYFFFLLISVCAQQNIGIGTSTPDASALLQLSSNTKGILIPSMNSVDKINISSPADGLMVYDTDTKSYWYFNGLASAWKEINSSNILPTGTLNYTLRHNGTDWINNSYLINTGNKIGIGINSPTEGLHIDSSVKIGNSVWSYPSDSRFLKFGDADFITIGEDSSDDRLYLKAKDFVFGKSSLGYTGNVGIGVIGSPTASLHVNGNVRITDGNQAAGKVLTSDVNGNATWQDPAFSLMQNRVVLATPVSNASFVVPPGVTKLYIEMWSGGGNGSSYNSNAALQITGGGGGSGGYANFFLDVLPGAVITYNIGSVASGFNTALNFGGNQIAISNGSNADNNSGPGLGGILVANSFPNVFFSKGSGGANNLNTVYTIGTTTYIEYRGGNGADAPFGGAGGIGEVSRLGYNSVSDSGNFPGGGGGASTANSTSIKVGGNGAIIIKY